jgi:LysM repeat protein
MAGRSPARFLAPLALVAFVVALLLVVNGTTGGSDAGSSAKPGASQQQPSGGAKPVDAKTQRHAGTRRVYVVKPGDTPSAIAQKTGVPLQDIERLNPNLNPQALSPGQRLKLRP